MKKTATSSMCIIAFDLGKNMAWAYNNGTKLTWGSALYPGERAARLAGIMRDLPNVIGNKKFDVLVYETPFARGRDATRSMWGIAGILEACATAGGMAVVDVAVPTIKKFATGDGHAPKDAMIVAAKRFGYKGSSEHEADAVCLLRYAEFNLERAP